MAYMRCLEIVSGFPVNLTIIIINITITDIISSTLINFIIIGDQCYC